MKQLFYPGNSVVCGTVLLLCAAALVYAGDEDPQFFRTGREKARGVVVVAHGLNVKPSKMGTPDADGTLVRLLLDTGYHVMRTTLSGHAGPIETMKTVSASRWLADAYSQYRRAETAAYAETPTGAKRLPLYLVAFSLGALVYECLMNGETETPVIFDAVVLLSPAVAVKNAARSLLLLDPFLKDGSIIASRSPAEYRAQKGASAAAYHALFSLEDQLCEKRFARSNVNTLVFIDPRDEMISARKLRKRIAEYRLSAWEVAELTNSGGNVRPKYHHLIIDSNCVDSETWKFITETLLQRLDAQKEPAP
jgi:esterase/lipase